MATVGATRGLRGWVWLNLFCAPATLEACSDWLLRKPSGSWQSIGREQVEQHRDRLLVKFAGCDDREQARSLRQAEIAVCRGLLPELEPGNYYWHDLLGMTVRTAAGQSLGLVSDIFATGANDVLVALDANRVERLIPLTADRLCAVDAGTRTLTVDWPLEDL